MKNLLRTRSKTSIKFMRWKNSFRRVWTICAKIVNSWRKRSVTYRPNWSKKRKKKIKPRITKRRSHKRLFDWIKTCSRVKWKSMIWNNAKPQRHSNLKNVSRNWKVGKKKLMNRKVSERITTTSYKMISKKWTKS